MWKNKQDHGVGKTPFLSVSRSAGWALGGIVLLVAACALQSRHGEQFPQRATGSHSSQVGSLITWVEEIRRWANSGLTETSCIPSLSRYYRDLLELSPASQLAREISEKPAEANRAFFEARQDLRDGLYRLYREGAYTEGCADQARHVMRVLRYTEEYIAEHALKTAPYDPKKPYPYLAGDRPYLHLGRGIVSFTPK
ncbi:hypothetical protein EBZ37_02685, partial [bacterium]|nr:hypothetical protein [bacterium]